MHTEKLDAIDTQVTDRTSDTGRGRRLGLGLLACSLALMSAHWLIYSPYTIDDAFISYRYAENLAGGAGLVYNPGERVEGYTNFLWVVLLSVGHSAGLATPMCAKVLGFALSLGSVVFVYLLTCRAEKANNLAGGLAALLLASSGLFAASGADGLETQLLTALMLCGLYLHLGETGDARGFPWSALLFLAAGLARPDGCLFFGAVVLDRLLLRRVKLHSYDAVMVFLVVAGGLIYFLWRYHYYGHLWPNTFYAKEFATGALTNRGLHRFGAFVWHLGISGLPLLVVWATMCKPGRGHVLIVLVIVSRLIFAVPSGGAWMGWEYHRFFLPTVPLIYVLAGMGLAEMVRRSQSQSSSWRRKVAVILAACALGGNMWVSLESILPGRYAYAEGLARAHIRLGHWLKENAPADSVLACGDAGALPYYSGLKTIDILGLNDDHIAHLEGGFYGKLDPEYILARRPDFVVVLSATKDVFTPRTAISALLQVRLARDREYRRLSIFMFDESYFLWVYEKLPAPN